MAFYKKNTLIFTLVILLFCIALMIKLVNENFYKIEKFNQDVKYAVCIWGELRSIDSTIDNFYNNLITPLNADLYLMVKNPNDNMDSRFDLFKNTIHRK